MSSHDVKDDVMDFVSLKRDHVICLIMNINL